METAVFLDKKIYSLTILGLAGLTDVVSDFFFYNISIVDYSIYNLFIIFMMMSLECEEKNNEH